MALRSCCGSLADPTGLNPTHSKSRAFSSHLPDGTFWYFPRGLAGPHPRRVGMAATDREGDHQRPGLLTLLAACMSLPRREGWAPGGDTGHRAVLKERVGGGGGRRRTHAPCCWPLLLAPCHSPRAARPA